MPANPNACNAVAQETAGGKPRTSYSGTFFPEQRRKRLSERIDALLANPHAARCADACPICAAVPEEIDAAVLAEWDAFARAGIWPITVAGIVGILRARGVHVEEAPALRKLLSHRRYRVLHLLVRADIQAYEQDLIAEG